MRPDQRPTIVAWSFPVGTTPDAGGIKSEAMPLNRYAGEPSKNAPFARAIGVDARDEEVHQLLRARDAGEVLFDSPATVFGPSATIRATLRAVAGLPCAQPTSAFCACESRGDAAAAETVKSDG